MGTTLDASKSEWVNERQATGYLYHQEDREHHHVTLVMDENFVRKIADFRSCSRSLARGLAQSMRSLQIVVCYIETLTGDIRLLCHFELRFPWMNSAKAILERHRRALRKYSIYRISFLASGTRDPTPPGLHLPTRSTLASATKLFLATQHWPHEFHPTECLLLVHVCDEQAKVSRSVPHVLPSSLPVMILGTTHACLARRRVCLDYRDRSRLDVVKRIQVIFA